MTKIKLILQEGWTCKRQVLDRPLLRYMRIFRYFGVKLPQDPHLACCVNCETTLELGSMVWLLRDDKGLRRAVFCSVQCQRQFRLSAFVKARRPRQPQED